MYYNEIHYEIHKSFLYVYRDIAIAFYNVVAWRASGSERRYLNLQNALTFSDTGQILSEL